MQSKTGSIHQQADLTQGTIWRQLVRFALPLLASSLIQQMYNTVDLIFIGQLIGKEASAAVGASSLVVSCMVGFFTGMSIGSNILAAKFFGSKNDTQLKSVVSASFILSIAGGLALTVAGYVLAPTFLHWLRIPVSIYDVAVEYLRFYVLSLIPMAVYNIGAGILRGLGNSKAPMLYQMIGGICNILVNALFIGVFGWGVRGAAVATLCSQGLVAVLLLWNLCRLDGRYCLRFQKNPMPAGMLKNIMTVGIPASIQAITVTLSNLIVQHQINRLGVDTIAAFTAYFKVELFIYLPIMAIGQANVTFTSQNIGANRPQRAVKGTKVSIFIGLIITIITTCLLLLLCRQAFSLFTKDADVIEIGMCIALITFPFYFLYVFLESFASFVRGYGKTLPPTLIILANMCLVRPAYVMVVSHILPGVTAIAWVYPITWFTTSLCMVLCYLSYQRIR